MTAEGLAVAERLDDTVGLYDEHGPGPPVAGRSPGALRRHPPRRRGLPRRPLRLPAELLLSLLSSGRPHRRPDLRLRHRRRGPQRGAEPQPAGGQGHRALQVDRPQSHPRAAVRRPLRHGAHPGGSLPRAGARGPGDLPRIPAAAAPGGGCRPRRRTSIPAPSSGGAPSSSARRARTGAPIAAEAEVHHLSLGPPLHQPAQGGRRHPEPHRQHRGLRRPPPDRHRLEGSLSPRRPRPVPRGDLDPARGRRISTASSPT